MLGIIAVSPYRASRFVGPSLVLVTLSTTLAVWWLWKFRNDGNDDHDANDSTETDLSYLPSHLRRELRKEERRQEMIPFLAMKKPMYDNVRMLDPGGVLLSTISEKKANWYVKKGLGEWKDAKCIRLLFEPQGRSSLENGEFVTSIKQNICVACGDDGGYYMRCSIVPYKYRCLLPLEYKEHMPHDVVPLCPDCHVVSEQASSKRMQQMENHLRRKGGYAADTAYPYRQDSHLHQVRSAALALLRWKHKLPTERIEEYQQLLYSHLGTTILEESLLQETANLQTRVANTEYISGSDLIRESLVDDEDIEEFIFDWRRHFVATLEPQYLPQGWSVESAVRSDQRGSNKTA